MLETIFRWARDIVCGPRLRETVVQLAASVVLAQQMLERHLAEVQGVRVLIVGNEMIYTTGTASEARAFAADLSWRKKACVTMTELEVPTPDQRGN